MNPPIRKALLCTTALLLAACSRLPEVGELPLVYRPDIQQGNVVTPEMLAQLKRGMEPRQVRFIMGTPIINDTFHSERWDYLYTFNEKGEPVQRRLVTLVFAEGLLDRAEGDVQPALGELIVDTRAQDKTVEVPRGRERGFFGRIADRLSGKYREKKPEDPPNAGDILYRDPTNPEVREENP